MKRSISENMYPKLKQPAEPKPKRPPADGWAKQRAKWGDNVDHVSRQYVSPLGGQVKRKETQK